MKLYRGGVVHKAQRSTPHHEVYFPHSITPDFSCFQNFLFFNFLSLVLFFKDLLVTAAFTFMWLVSSSAWGKGLTDVKTATNPSNVITLFESCKVAANKCTEGAVPHMGRLNVSVVSFFSFFFRKALTCVTDSLWFIFKKIHVLFLGRFLVSLISFFGPGTAGSFSKKLLSTNQPTSLQMWRDKFSLHKWTFCPFKDFITWSVAEPVALTTFTSKTVCSLLFFCIFFIFNTKNFSH